MKKRIIIVIILLLLLFSGIITFKIIKNNNDKERYEQIKSDVKNEANRYLTLMYSTDKKEVFLYDDDIINPNKRGADKNILLDIDEKSYCKIAIHGYVINDKWDSNVYLKCNDYNDKEYDDMIEWLKCTRVMPKEYYSGDMEHFVCPKDKQEYLDNLSNN